MTPFLSIDEAAHVVQVALTPIFMLAGVASLLNVFTSRLARVADRVHALAAEAGPHRRELALLRMRSRALDVAVVFASLAGALTCGAAMSLFFGALRQQEGGVLLFTTFAGALTCTIIGIGAYVFEILLSGREVRESAAPDAGTT